MVFLRPFIEFITEKIDLSDVVFEVENSNIELLNHLVNGISVVGRKRSPKSIRVKKITGFFHDEKHPNKKDKLLITTNMGDIILARLDEEDDSVSIRINDELIYDMTWVGFNEKTFIEKIIEEYRKHLKSNKWKL